MFCVPPDTRTTSEREVYKSEGSGKDEADRNRPGKALLTDAKTGVGRRVLLSNMSSSGMTLKCQGNTTQ